MIFGSKQRMQVNDIKTGSSKFDTLLKLFYDYYNSDEYKKLNIQLLKEVK